MELTQAETAAHLKPGAAHRDFCLTSVLYHIREKMVWEAYGIYWRSSIEVMHHGELCRGVVHTLEQEVIPLLTGL